MEHSVFPAVKLNGSLRVPGEPEAASRALILAIAAQGSSYIDNAPAPLDTAAAALSRLGPQTNRDQTGLHVEGDLANWSTPETPIEPQLPVGATLLLAALLATRSFPTRLRTADTADIGDALETLAGHLKKAGALMRRETDRVWLLGPSPDFRPTEFDAGDMGADLKQALLLAGLGHPGTTVLLEAQNSRDGAERLLRRCGLHVPRQRGESKEPNRLSLQGDRPFGAFQAQIPGDLDRAMPFIVAGVCLKGSKLNLENVALPTGGRAPLELMRQIGAPLKLSENDSGHTDILASFSRLKSTRIGGKRMQPLRRHLALLAVMATQVEGEVVLRDVEDMRQGAFDYIAHLVELLRAVGARVGEFPEGLVVKGGPRLKGARVDARGDVGLATAFGIAGLFAKGETVVENSDGLEALHPGFFTTLESLKEK
jgi:3-phosphoshikimate 1-carboxyvinyltransferase